MNIITRAQWNARAPKADPVHVDPARRAYFVVHHSGGPVDQTVRAIQDWCMDGRGFSDIDYNHLVRGDSGEIYQGRGWDVVGAHTTGYNTTGYGVCIIGTDTASAAAKASVRWLYDEMNRRAGKTLAIKGHRDLATTGTDCPGEHVYAWVKAGLPAPTTEDDVTAADVWAADTIPVHDGKDTWQAAGTLGLTFDRAAAAAAGVARIEASMSKLLAGDRREASEVPPSADQVADAVMAKLGAQPTPEQTAQLLRTVLGADAPEVGRLLAAAA